MITRAPTEQRLKAWRALFLQYRPTLSPNKKTGAELLCYLREKYPLQQMREPAALSIVADNVAKNAFYAEKLPAGAAPNPVGFFVKNAKKGKLLYQRQKSAAERAGEKIFVGIDLATGYFAVEGSEQLWDELCAFSGLDERDLENYACVGLYLECLQKLGGQPSA